MLFGCWAVNSWLQPWTTDSHGSNWKWSETMRSFSLCSHLSWPWQLNRIRGKRLGVKARANPKPKDHLLLLNWTPASFRFWRVLSAARDKWCHNSDQARLVPWAVGWFSWIAKRLNLTSGPEPRYLRSRLHWQSSPDRTEESTQPFHMPPSLYHVGVCLTMSLSLLTLP